MSRIRRFLSEAWSELKKVTWPTPAQARNLTALVIGVSAAVAVYLAFFDYIFGFIVKQLNAG